MLPEMLSVFRLIPSWFFKTFTGLRLGQFPDHLPNFSFRKKMWFDLCFLFVCSFFVGFFFFFVLFFQLERGSVHAIRLQVIYLSFKKRYKCFCLWGTRLNVHNWHKKNVTKSQPNHVSRFSILFDSIKYIMHSHFGAAIKRLFLL